jgi:hypothetical protein
LEAGPEARHQIRGELAVLQNELFESAYDIAEKGRDLIENGSVGLASELLTNYMSENAQRVISKVKSMVPATAGVR